jgi:hypothetical protein
MSEIEKGFIHEEEKTEKKPNLFDNIDSVIDAVIAIESEVSKNIGIVERDVLRREVFNARAKIEETLSLLSDEEKDRFKNTPEHIWVSGFQGLGGWNRYRVLANGEVRLLKSHSFEKCIKKAQELGIDTPDF